jgi:hypothetical protein
MVALNSESEVLKRFIDLVIFRFELKLVCATAAIN